MAVKRRYTRDEAADLYSQLNNEGKGFAIGEANQKVWDAISNAGYYFEANYGIGIYHVTKDGREFLVGGDGMGRNAWAVQIQQQGAPAPATHQRSNMRNLTADECGALIQLDEFIDCKSPGHGSRTCWEDIKPTPDFPEGLELHEYRFVGPTYCPADFALQPPPLLQAGERIWVQVALDPARDWVIVAHHVSPKPEEFWVVSPQPEHTVVRMSPQLGFLALLPGAHDDGW